MSAEDAGGGAVSNGVEPEPEKIPELTDRQVHLIEETWKLVAADLQSAGTCMFLK